MGVEELAGTACEQWDPPGDHTGKCIKCPEGTNIADDPEAAGPKHGVQACVVPQKTGKCYDDGGRCKSGNCKGGRFHDEKNEKKDGGKQMKSHGSRCCTFSADRMDCDACN